MGHYKKCFRRDSLEGYEHRDVGAIMDTEADKAAIYIVIATDRVQAAQHRDSLTDAQRPGKAPVIYVTFDFALKLQANDSTAWFKVYHELGHILLEHSEQNLDNAVDNSEARMQAIYAGNVCSREREADAFAAEHLGKSAALKALIHMQKECFDFGVKLGKATNAVVAFREYEARIKALQSLA